MRRLYHQIYLGFVAVIVLLIAVAVVPDWIYLSRQPLPAFLTQFAEDLGNSLPAKGPELAPALEHEAKRLGLDATLWSSDDTVLASSGEQVGPPVRSRERAHWLRRRGPPGIAVELSDGRWLALSLRHEDIRQEHRWPFGLLIFALVVAAGALPLSRRITRRLERLRSGVEKLGAGDLTARVPVEGRDEVADLATSFNDAAERIENLVGTQRRMLASASHELRTPLARLRVAVELMSKDAPPELQNEASADIGELDDLIEDLLLAARLESGSPNHREERVELLAIAAEEAARVGATVSGAPTEIVGDPKLLRRMIRNLAENARRYGGGSPIDVSVSKSEAGARLEVADRGPGIPEEDLGRVFEPFYRASDHSEGEDGGVGLGLALVREIARSHGGDVECTRRPGGGTLLVVTLPHPGA